MHLIIGLGNPGAKYARTRHNAGWLVLDEMARRHSLEIARKEHKSLTASGTLHGEKIMLVKPQTFMNASGEAVSALMRYNRVPMENLLVICDDLALPVGKIRLRASGSDGGQNGLKSIIQTVSSREFARLRLGIGEPPRQQREERGSADYVLSAFAPDEKPLFDDAARRAADCAETWVREGAEEAMNAFNRGTT